MRTEFLWTIRFSFCICMYINSISRLIALIFHTTLWWPYMAISIQFLMGASYPSTGDSTPKGGAMLIRWREPYYRHHIYGIYRVRQTALLHMAKMFYSFCAWTSNLVASKLECMMGGLYEMALQSPSLWFTPLITRITLIHQRVSRPYLLNTVSGSQSFTENVWRHARLTMTHAATSAFLNGNPTLLNRSLSFRKQLKQQAICVFSCQSSIVNWTSSSSFGAWSRNSSVTIVNTISRHWRRIYQRLWTLFTSIPFANGSIKCIIGLKLTSRDLGYAMLKLLISVRYCLYKCSSDVRNWPSLRSKSHSVLQLKKPVLGIFSYHQKEHFSKRE